MALMRWWIIGLLLAAGGAQAQLSLFEHDNYRGRRIDVRNSAQDLSTLGANDMIASVVVRGGQWQLCEDAGYRGRCITLREGNYPSLQPFGMSDKLSSARIVGGGDGGQTRPPVGGNDGAGRIVLYDGYGFSGRATTIDRDAPDLTRYGFNDRAQSAVVTGGNWIICEHGNFGGDCQTLNPGRYATLGGLSLRVSSLRAAGSSGPGSGAGFPPAWGHDARAILYESPNFTGRQFVVDRDRIDDLNGTGFNDRASSMRVERGYWMFCSDARFGGECRTFGPGDYAELGYGLNNRISSGRRISNQYPYNQSPVWGTP